LVTHKAFLRELERGPLGQAQAEEFGNSEVRVYDVTLHVDGVVTAALRHSRQAPWKAPSPPCFQASTDRAVDVAAAAVPWNTVFPVY